jgi:2'-5' RNA ligase
LFVAAWPSADVRHGVAAACAQASQVEALRWTSEDKLHVTLQFLGSVAQERVPEIESALRAAASSQHAFAVQLAGAGAFPHAKRAAVLWVGAREGGAALSELSASVVRETARVGIVPEERAFHPHLTLARLKPPRNVLPLMAALDAALDLPSFSLREIHLVRSQLGREGARYENVAVFPLAPALST